MQATEIYDISDEIARVTGFARDYLRHGLALFPTHVARRAPDGTVVCSCRKGAACTQPGKHPACSHGFKDATTAPAQLKALLNTAVSWTPGAVPGLAVATGSSHGLLVIDVDPKNDGYRSLCELEKELGALPDTWTVITGSGGRHFYFRHSVTPIPSRANAFGSDLFPGIDTRAEHGYVVAPPTPHKSGGRYRWHPRLNAGHIGMAAFPSRWVDALLASSRGDEKRVAARAARVGAHRATLEVKAAGRLLHTLLRLPLVRWCEENPNDLGRELWRGLATNIGAVVVDCPDLESIARAAFHKLSEDYDGYRKSETDRVFTDAISSAESFGPMRLDTMIANGAPADLCRGAASLVAAARFATARRRTGSVRSR